MPKVLPEYLELRRQQILDAAALCFGKKGFHHSTMQDICDQAELSPGAVYRYFRSKEEIIEAMCARGQDETGRAIDRAISLGDTSEVFNDLIATFFLDADAFRAPEICALNVELISEATRNENVRAYLTANNHNVSSRFIEIIRVAQAKGEINPDLDPEAVTRVMVALYQGFITQKLVEPDLDPFSDRKVMQALFGGSFWLGRQAGAPERRGSAALQH